LFAFPKLQSTSPYIRFDVTNLTFSISCQCPSTTATATLSNEVAPENATKRWPWKKMGDVCYIPTLLSVCA
jgi:hypothetical protein